MPYYAVLNGRSVGVYGNWEDCKSQVHGYPRAVFRKFSTQNEAFSFLNSNGQVSGPRPGSGSKSNSGIGKPSHTNRRVKLIDNPPPCRCGKINSYARVIYTDGATFLNGSDDATSGAGIYYQTDDEVLHVPLPRTIRGIRTTNQRAELMAIWFVLRQIFVFKKYSVHYTIRSDSEYSIKAITEWLKNWERNEYKDINDQPVKNQDLIKDVVSLYKAINEASIMDDKGCVNLEHVRGHQGNQGNEIADRIAKESATLNDSKLWCRCCATRKKCNEIDDMYSFSTPPSFW